MIKLSRMPYGYRDLLVYKKAEKIQASCSELTHLFPRMKTLIALADQMDRSARSVKQNIVEGWKRNSTKEYYEFLGFSLGANAELEEDCDDVWKGVYPELLAEKGVMGEKGERGEMRHTEIGDIEKLRFYPIDPNLPSVVQLKLRCKEMNFLLDRLQKSLVEKMETENTLSRNDKILKKEAKWRQEEKFSEELMKKYNLKRLENGQVVKDE